MWLSIEIGETAIAAVLDVDGRAQPLLFEGVPRMPAGVFVNGDGSVLTGRDALQAAASQPGSYLARPVKELTAGAVSVGGSSRDPLDLVAAVLRTVAEQARRTARRPVPDAVLTIPAGWGPRRRTALRLAAHRAGFTEPTLVDSAKAVAEQLISDHATTGVADGGLVLVYRLVETFEVALLRRQGTDWYNEATIGLDDVTDLAPADAIARTLDIVGQALTAIDAGPTDVTVVCCQVPLTQVAMVNAGLHGLGLTAPVLSASELDAAYGALRLTARSISSLRSRASAARHAASIILPIGGAGVLLWLKLNSGRYTADPYSIPPLSYIRPPYMYTIWPAWTLVPMLVLLGAISFIVGRAAARHRSTMPEPDQRRRLASGLRAAVYVSLAVAIAASVLGARQYPVTPIWYFLVWMTPAALLCAIVAGYSFAIEHGTIPLTDWRQRLTYPLTPMALATVGVLAVEVYLETNTSLFAALTYGSGLPDWTIRAGTALVALAVITMATHRTMPRLIAGTAAVVVLLIAYEYNVIAMTVGAYVVALLLWWVLRIRPRRLLARLAEGDPTATPRARPGRQRRADHQPLRTRAANANRWAMAFLGRRRPARGSVRVVGRFDLLCRWLVGRPFGHPDKDETLLGEPLPQSPLGRGGTITRGSARAAASGVTTSLPWR